MTGSAERLVPVDGRRHVAGRLVVGARSERRQWRVRNLIEKLGSTRRVRCCLRRNNGAEVDGSCAAAPCRGHECFECFDPLPHEPRRLRRARHMRSNPARGHSALLAVRLFRPERVHDTYVAKLASATRTHRCRFFKRMIETKSVDVFEQLEPPKAACGSPSACATLVLTGSVQKMKVVL